MREIKFRGKRLDNGEWEYGACYSTMMGLFVSEYIVKITQMMALRKGCGIKRSKHFARIAQFTQYKQVMGEIAPIAVH